MKHKDERAKLTNAILSDIKVIKLYGWEKIFMEKVLGIRKQELQALKRSQILFSASLASFHSSTFLVSGSPSYVKHAITSIFLCTPLWTDFSCGTAKDKVCLEELVVSQELPSPSGISHTVIYTVLTVLWMSHLVWQCVPCRVSLLCKNRLETSS